jgi:hypothetical protein
MDGMRFGWAIAGVVALLACGPRSPGATVPATGGGPPAGDLAGTGAAPDDDGPSPPSPESPPPMPLSVAAFAGQRDWAPVFLGDGPTLAWLRQQDCGVSLCTAAPPYAAAAACRRLAQASCAINQLGRAAASGDGRHVFVALEGGLTHLMLDGTAVTGEEAIPEAGFSLDLAPAADGSRLFTETDGPSTAVQSPGWRAVTLYERTDAGWSRTLLTAAEPPRLAELIAAAAAGRTVLYVEGSADRWGTPERIRVAEETDGGWRDDDLAFRGLALRPVALAADGRALLLRGFPRAEGDAPAGFHLYLARREDGGWSEPAVVVRDEPRASVYLPGMSADGFEVFWEHYTRGEDGNAIVRSEVRVIRFRDGGWSEPAIVAGYDGHFQIDRLTFNGRGQAAFDVFSRAGNDSDRFVLHAHVVPEVDAADPVVVRLSDLSSAP